MNILCVCVCVCVRACVLACLRACVRACVRARGTCWSHDVSYACLVLQEADKSQKVPLHPNQFESR
jgi:hypothetical protein